MEKPTILKLTAVFVFVSSYFAYKQLMKKHYDDPVSPQSTSASRMLPEPVRVQETAPSAPEPEVISEAPSEVPIADAAPEEVLSEEEEKVRKLHSVIYKHGKAIELEFEGQVRDLLKSNNHEESFSKYLAIKEERNSALKEHLSTNTSQRGLYDFNAKYHNKLIEIFGRDLYKEYLLLLRSTNDKNSQKKPAIKLSI